MTEIENSRRHRRRLRLEQLLDEVGSAAQVERDTGTHRSYLSALVHATRGVGDKLATKLEMQYGKPSGWFDLPIESPVAANEMRGRYSTSSPSSPRSSGGAVNVERSDPRSGPIVSLISQDLKHTLRLLASQLAALPEVPRKSVLYFIQQIGNDPAEPNDWIEQAGAVVQSLPLMARNAQSGETVAVAAPRDPDGKAEPEP